MTETIPETLEAHVGQMLMAGFDGHTAPEYFLEWLRAGRLGGVILFARNVDTPQQVADLCCQLHAASKYPLLISIDQEGGTVARLREGFAESPGALALSSIHTNAATITQQVAAVLASEMRDLGINWTYAPVVDVTYNRDNPTVGTRSFGKDPTRIAELATATVQGFQSHGVAACAKHFPGLGDTAIDTHHALPRLQTPLAQLQQNDLLPYRALVSNNLATIMTTHTIFTALDDEQPATHSPFIVQKLIREMLSFDGVVTTDCMEMKAIDDNYSIAESVVLAANAGIDIILFSHTKEKQEAAFHHLLEAAQKGKVPQETIAAANRRIAALKARFPAQVAENVQVNTPEHQQIMLKAAKASLTMLNHPENRFNLPATDQSILLVEFSPIVDSPVQETRSTAHLSTYVQQRLPHIKTVILPARPSSEHLMHVQTRDIDMLMIASRNAHLIPEQSAALQTLHQAHSNILLLALRNPYDSELLPDTPVLCSAGDSRPSLEAVAAALMHDFMPEGIVDRILWH